jgi:hypothetical protein
VGTSPELTNQHMQVRTQPMCILSQPQHSGYDSRLLPVVQPHYCWWRVPLCSQH